MLPWNPWDLSARPLHHGRTVAPGHHYNRLYWEHHWTTLAQQRAFIGTHRLLVWQQVGTNQWNILASAHSGFLWMGDNWFTILFLRTDRYIPDGPGEVDLIHREGNTNGLDLGWLKRFTSFPNLILYYFFFKYHPLCVISHMLGVRCQVSGFRCEVSGVRCQVSSVKNKN